METEKELTIKFELDSNGKWTCTAHNTYQFNQSFLSAGGKLTLEDGGTILERLATFVKSLESSSTSDFWYNRSAPSK